ncbi:hypothetical protein ID866_6308 [Astraeus odoratus]|nr:hypothetical protein ID866_6308 [Astraeus odoratus]
MRVTPQHHQKCVQDRSLPRPSRLCCVCGKQNQTVNPPYLQSLCVCTEELGQEPVENVIVNIRTEAEKSKTTSTSMEFY